VFDLDDKGIMILANNGNYKTFDNHIPEELNPHDSREEYELMLV
jgi:hypothetical protein